jgi:hypothetical protein
VKALWSKEARGRKGWAFPRRVLCEASDCCHSFIIRICHRKPGMSLRTLVENRIKTTSMLVRKTVNHVCPQIIGKWDIFIFFP